MVFFGNANRWKKSLLNFSAFALAFQVQIQIKAKPHQIEIPGACHENKDFPCLIKTMSHSFHKKNKLQKYHIAKQSVYQSNTQFEHQLISGDFWIEQSQEGVWKTPFIEISGQIHSMWIHAEPLRTYVRNLNGIDLQFKTRSGQTVVIPSGFVGWVGEINDQGQNLVGVVQPIELRTLVKDWYPLFPGNDKEFVAEVQKLKNRWAETTEMASMLYRQNGIEQITELKNSEAAMAAAEEHRKNLKKQARQYFLERSFSR